MEIIRDTNYNYKILSLIHKLLHIFVFISFESLYT